MQMVVRLVLVGCSQQLGSSHSALHVEHSVRTACRELALVPPLLGSSQRLLLRNHTETYYGDMPLCESTVVPLRRHGDEVQALPGAYYRALGRCDDTMNLGGIKVKLHAESGMWSPASALEIMAYACLCLDACSTVELSWSVWRCSTCVPS